MKILWTRQYVNLKIVEEKINYALYFVSRLI